MSLGGATLALAAMGQTIVVLTGGFDLSAGAVVSLVNVVLAHLDGPRAVEPAPVRAWSASASAPRSAPSTASSSPCVRLQPIVVTLSTMFIVQGVTLLIMDKPGGMIAPEFSALPGRRRDPGPAAGAGRGHRAWRSLLWLLAQEHPLRRRPLRHRQRPGGGPRRRPVDVTLVQLRRLRRGRHVLRRGGRLHLGPDRLGRSADRQADAPADLHRRGARRHAARRRSRRLPGHGLRRLHPDAGRQHPARAQRLGLLQLGRRGRDPDPGRARGLA